MFNMQDHQFDGLDVALLTTANDNATIGLIQSLLEGNQIPYLTKDRESGGYMRVLGGFSIFGTDIYVPSSELERAKGLIDAYISGGETPPDDDAPPEAK